MKNVALASIFIASASAFPWVVNQPGVDSSLLGGAGKKVRRQQSGGFQAGGPATCPFNADHKGAAPYNAKYPYNGAKNGLPGKGVGGYQVPADGDTAHYFTPPGKNDIRGPCPGLNAAANHNFLSHDGITTFNELVDAQQNLYNVGYDLATLLATLGLVTADGDVLTQKLSIGCDATSRTSFNPLISPIEPGLDGHNKFEADSSLTRNDYFTHNGDNFSFNGTLFGKMVNSTGGYFGRDQLAKYRYERYQESLAENPNFFFSPLALLLYGAASFLYELMPSGTRNYQPDLETISSFFGAEQQKDGTWAFNNAERIPANWTNRVSPYTNEDVTTEILAQYLEHPVLFGGKTSDNSFDTINFGSIKNGKLEGGVSGTNTACLLYQLTTGNIPAFANGLITPTVEALSFAASKLGPQFKNLGCPIALT
jgi:hypothetical protein